MIVIISRKFNLCILERKLNGKKEKDRWKKMFKIIFLAVIILVVVGVIALITIVLIVDRQSKKVFDETNKIFRKEFEDD